MRKLFLLLSVLFVVSCSSSAEEELAPVIKYTLTTSANPTTGGTITPASGQHTEGATVSITATPAAEYLFSSWTGATGTTATTSVVMNSNKTVIANFVKKKYALSTSVEGEGTVTEKVIKAGAATDYNSGTVVELTATPKDGWEFKEWTGDLTGSDNPKEITIDKAKTVKAVFISNSGGGGGSGEPFTTTWAIETGDFKFPLKDYADITIDWGDDSTSNHTDGVFPTHSYASSATFTIKVTVNDANKDIGKMWMVDNQGSAKLIRTVENWGEGKWSDFDYAYSGATNLTITANDEPDLSLTTDMDFAFRDCTSLVGTTLNDWDVSTITTMYATFFNAESFNADISAWNISKVTDMGQVFRQASAFNQDISSWDTSAVTSMKQMFYDATAFNGNISGWDTSKVVSMWFMFYKSAFNQDISSWVTSAVTNMSFMFNSATAFNQDIGSWDTSKVVNMENMFYLAAAFNKDLNLWDTSKVTDMDMMFRQASAFNQDISSWDTSKVTSMSTMFGNAIAFNGNISSWDTAAVTDMQYMFYGATAFNQNLSGWCVTNISSEPSNFSTSSALTGANKPIWGTCPGNSYTIAVTASSNADYTLSGKDRNGDVSGNDPSLTFKVGDEVTFSVNATGHPFYLKTVVGTGTDNQISGVTNNGATSGSVVWTPTAAGTYYYICSLHSGMVGTITIQN